MFRFEENSIKWVADHFLGAQPQELRGGALSSKKKMEVLMRYLADPGFQTGVGVDVGYIRAQCPR